MEKILCIDIGGTSIKFGIYNFSGQIVKKIAERPNENTVDPNSIRDQVMSVIQFEKSIDGVAISTAGVVNPETGEIIYSGYTIPYYIGTSWKKEIKEAFNLPCEIENDVNCATLGEKWKGELQYVSNGICLTIGTGIGAGILINDRIYSGEHYTAGEIGYMILGNRNFQDIASTTYLLNSYKDKTGQQVNGVEFFKEVKDNNEDAMFVLNEMLSNLANGLVNIMYMINPERIVLGGGIMKQKEIIQPLLKDKIKDLIQDDYFMQTNIYFSSLDNTAGMLGALYNFMLRQNINI